MYKSKFNQMQVFEERGKPEYPGKNLSEQTREPTNSTHMTASLEIEPGPNWCEASALTTTPPLLSNKFDSFPMTSTN